jgi:hypothetical protein
MLGEFIAKFTREVDEVVHSAKSTDRVTNGVPVVIRLHQQQRMGNLPHTCLIFSSRSQLEALLVLEQSQIQLDRLRRDFCTPLR